MPQSPYQVYSAGQQINQGPGNRYIPPTYNYRAQGQGRPPNYNEMDWNNVQNYNLPQHGNSPYQQEYMSGLRGALSGFGQRYPQQMPQFGGGVHEFMANPEGYGSPVRGRRQEAYDYASQQPWFDRENYGGGRPQMPNFQGRGQAGGGADWQRMLMDFFQRMNPQQGGQQKPEWEGSGEGTAKPVGNPYDKIGYRG